MEIYILYSIDELSYKDKKECPDGRSKDTDFSQLSKKGKSFQKPATVILQKWFLDHITYPYISKNERMELVR